MSYPQRAARLFGAIMVIVSVPLGTGCVAVRYARGGDGGKDPAPIQPGTARAAAEVIVGSPLREWTSPAGIRYRTYQYDAGCPPSLSEAGAMLLVDTVTVGLFELVDAVKRLRHGTGLFGCGSRRGDERFGLAYDDSDIVIGIFDELDELPANGRSGPRKWRR